MNNYLIFAFYVFGVITFIIVSAFLGAWLFNLYERYLEKHDN